MKISYNWLKTYLQTEISLEQICETLTDIGLEVEGVESNRNSNLVGVVVGKVLEVKPHPNADRLRIGYLNLGDEKTTQIVCGAKNLEKNQLVPVATIGTELKIGKDTLKIKKSKIRGEESFGMICSDVELGLGEDNSGIKIFDEEYEPGSTLDEIYNAKIDSTIEIGLTPNRADAMSHFGVARDLYAALQARKIPVKWVYESPQKQERKETINFPIEIIIQNPELAPRYAAAYIDNITIKDSPAWLQSQLKAIGITPKNNVVDITNYILHDLGQPLHAFDADKIHDQKVVVKTLPQDSKFITLDDKERTLDQGDLMICDAEKGMCIAGVLGGTYSGVSENTTSILLESAFFNPVSIRKTAKRHGINTDASFRFERQIDSEITIKALEKACLLLEQYAEGNINYEYFDFYPKPLEPKMIDLRLHQLDKIVGQKIHREDIKRILQFLEIEIGSDHNGILQLKVPTYRVDVERECDVIEEILRIYGYNQIENTQKIQFSPQVESENRKKTNEIEKSVLNLLVHRGFYETLNNSLYATSFVNLFSLPREKTVEIFNPLSADLSVMRQSLLPGLLQNIEYNINRKESNLQLFELGKVYEKQENKFRETSVLALAITGSLHREHWQKKIEQFRFFDLKSFVNLILRKLKVEVTEEKVWESQLCDQGISIYYKKELLVNLGTVSKNILGKMNIKQNVFYAEMFWENLLRNRENQSFLFREVSKFPGTKRDLSLVLNHEVSYNDVYRIGKEQGTKWLKKIQLFDVYEGEKLPEGKKSYAIRYEFENHEKTITDKEVDEIMARILKEYKQELNIELRN